MKEYTTILSIAGSDSIGGAGIQADIKTACAMGVYAMTAITAVTAQSTQGVFSYRSVGAELLLQQIRAVCEDEMPDAVKIGMVPDADCAEVITDAIKRYELKNVVLDPVMVSTSGSVLTENSAIEFMFRETFGLVDLITPNIPEAKALLQKGYIPDEMLMWPVMLSERSNCPNVLLKGGHGEGRELTDYLWCGGTMYAYQHELIYTLNTHGTGCSLSTAIACGLASGKPLPEVTGHAIAWLQRAIALGSDYQLGRGNGPVNHMGI